MTAVEVQSLYKSYAGNPAVRDLSFTVEPGEVLEEGLLRRHNAASEQTCIALLQSIHTNCIELFRREHPLPVQGKIFI